jgi:hypothetical protein
MAEVNTHIDHSNQVLFRRQPGVLGRSQQSPNPMEDLSL